MREFRPPSRPSVVRVVLAVVLAVAALGPTGFLLRSVLGLTQIRYEIAGSALTVRSGDPTWGDRTVQLADVREVRVVDLRGGRRTSGTALSGYCAGHFSYDGLGAVWQATNCSGRALLVRSVDAKTPMLVLTPPDLDGFQAALAVPRELSVALPPVDKGPLVVLAWIVFPLATITTFMVGSLMLFGPSRMRYLVGEGTLRVRTMYGRKRFELAGARAREHAPGRMWRVAGSGMPGYFTGIFREDGRTTRVYATDLKRTVLIEGPGDARVIVSPDDPRAFLAALRAEGAVVDPT
jgi:hypothetical protein